MASEENITQEKLKKHIHYNAETGVFTRLRSLSNRGVIGSEVGTNSCGYLVACVNKKQYHLHRLAWLYTYGYFPEEEIDHINGIRNDNRLKNLREVSGSCNRQNQKVNSRNTSGFPGVTWDKRIRKWQSSIRIRKKIGFLGYYDSKLDAALARFTAEVCDPEWTCNYRSELSKAIKNFWPEFNANGI